MTKNKEKWLKILGKGMITLPKEWRGEMGIETGDVVMARKEGNKLVIKSKELGKVPYRIYTDTELDEFLKEDELPKSLSTKVDELLSVQKQR